MVDQGDSPRLSGAEQDALACLCVAGACPLHDEGSDGYITISVTDLLAKVESIVASREEEWGVTGVDGNPRVWVARNEQHAREHAKPIPWSRHERTLVHRVKGWSEWAAAPSPAPGR